MMGAMLRPLKLEVTGNTKILLRRGGFFYWPTLASATSVEQIADVELPGRLQLKEPDGYRSWIVRPCKAQC